VGRAGNFKEWAEINFVIKMLALMKNVPDNQRVKKK